MKRTQHLIVVSNRLPITINVDGSGPRLEPSSGGLVTALGPVMESLPSTWIGWAGAEYSSAAEMGIADFQASYKMVPVHLTVFEREQYYEGFSNQVLWPLCHDLQNLCKFDATFWRAYQEVNEKFSDAVTEHATSGDLVWVHDYHLMLVGEHLRRRQLELRLAYFHHVPFPSPDIFFTLPSSEAVLRALLCFDDLGFQTRRDRHNFVQCVRKVFGRKLTLHAMGSDLIIQFEGIRTCVKVAPVSIDAGRFRRLALSSEVKARVQSLKASLGERHVLLGVDRLDYTKGLQQRLSSFRLLLENNPRLHEKIVLLQLVIPSREQVPEYETLKLSIERQVGEINGTFGLPNWTPVVYMHRNISCEELVSLYQIASVLLVTSLKDGMNLVAKEYCTCKQDDSGALVLSKFAGAAEELKVGAFLVNPNDREELAETCLKALKMNGFELKRRMSAMRQSVARHDIFHWLGTVFDDNTEYRQDMLQSSKAVAREIVA